MVCWTRLEVKAFVIDGDLGSGEPGSLQWHKCNVLQLTDNEKIAYIREAFPKMSDEDKLDLTVFLIVEKWNNGDGQWDCYGCSTTTRS